MTTAVAQGFLGFGRSRSEGDLLRRVGARLLEKLPSPGDARRSGNRRSRPLHLSKPVTFRSAGLPPGDARRVCVLPFANFSEARRAPRILGDLLMRRLALSGEWQPVEPAELRAAMRAEKIPTVRLLDTERLQSVSTHLGTSLFVRGTIWSWRERSPGAPPEVALELSLVDVAAGRVLWASNLARKGDEYQGLLLLGEIRDVVTLADQVAAELVEGEQKATPAGEPPGPAASATPVTPVTPGAEVAPPPGGPR
jgi:hypothetical protein